MATIGEMAKICRSKNAGPYNLTIDLLFEDKEVYLKIKNSDTLNKEIVSKLYKVEPEQVSIYFWDVVNAIKVTIPKLQSCGSRYDTDVFGAQQHMPLMQLEFVE